MPIDTKTLSLELIGGKGKSLAKMASAGMSVPSGFYLTTSAYKTFVETNNLQKAIINFAKPEIIGKTVSFDISHHKYTHICLTEKSLGNHNSSKSKTWKL